jgi:hypothetical protein
MWSLPDINALNARAKSCATAYDRESNPPKKHKHACDHCGKRAVHHRKYYDIFSDDAKGVLHLCDQHEDYQEGYFTCDCCGRFMVENHTWEYYRVSDGNGGVECLTCAAKNYFADPASAIDPKLVRAVVLEPDSVPQLLFNPKTGVLNLAKVRHVLGVKQPAPKGIEFVENFENANEQGTFDNAAILACIKDQDRPVYVVLDAAYQFSVSIGIYAK